MDQEANKNFNNLEFNLQSIIKTYRALLEVVRKEKEILIEARLDDLTENNLAKEKLLVSAGELEKERLGLTASLCELKGLPSEAPRLLDLANEIGGEGGDKLRSLHSVLVLLLQRVKDVNDQNEVLVQSALKNITGAMNSLKEDLKESGTYEKKGQKSKGLPISGNLVSKQV